MNIPCTHYPHAGFSHRWSYICNCMLFDINSNICRQCTQNTVWAIKKVTRQSRLSEPFVKTLKNLRRYFLQSCHDLVNQILAHCVSSYLAHLLDLDITTTDQQLESVSGMQQPLGSGVQQQLSTSGLVSPERVMVRFPGKTVA